MKATQIGPGSDFHRSNPDDRQQELEEAFNLEIMPRTRYEEIKELVKEGVLGPEECPVSNGVEYWHWLVIQPDKLPEWAQKQFDSFGEVRW